MRSLVGAPLVPAGIAGYALLARLNPQGPAMAALVQHWQSDHSIIAEGATVRLGAFQVSLNDRQQALIGRIEDHYRACGMSMPTISEVVDAVHAPPDHL